MSPPEYDQSSVGQPCHHRITTVNGVANTKKNGERLISNVPVEYTSLRDLFAADHRRTNNLEEIQIKNPLVKQAAVAYLWPRRSPPREDESWFKKLLLGGWPWRIRTQQGCYNCDDHKVGCVDFLKQCFFGR